MDNFKELSQTELQHTIGGSYPGVTVPIALPIAISKWIIGQLSKKK